MYKLARVTTVQLWQPGCWHRVNFHVQCRSGPLVHTSAASLSRCSCCHSVTLTVSPCLLTHDVWNQIEKVKKVKAKLSYFYVHIHLVAYIYCSFRLQPAHCDVSLSRNLIRVSRRKSLSPGKTGQLQAITQPGTNKNQDKLLNFLGILPLPPPLGSQPSAVAVCLGAATPITLSLLVQLKQIRLEIIIIVNEPSASLSHCTETPLRCSRPACLVQQLLHVDKHSIGRIAAVQPTAHRVLKTCSVSGTERRELETLTTQ